VGHLGSGAVIVLEVWPFMQSIVEVFSFTVTPRTTLKNKRIIKAKAKAFGRLINRRASLDARFNECGFPFGTCFLAKTRRKNTDRKIETKVRIKVKFTIEFVGSLRGESENAFMLGITIKIKVREETIHQSDAVFR
jgi:hypothetical protein